MRFMFVRVEGLGPKSGRRKGEGPGAFQTALTCMDHSNTSRQCRGMRLDRLDAEIESAPSKSPTLPATRHSILNEREKTRVPQVFRRSIQPLGTL